MQSESNKKDKCNHQNVSLVKHGCDENGTTRYICPKCGKTFIEHSDKLPGANEKIRLALHLLLLGYAIDEIADTIKCTNRSIKHWGKKYLPKLDLLTDTSTVESARKQLIKVIRPRSVVSFGNGKPKTLKAPKRRIPKASTRKKF